MELKDVYTMRWDVDAAVEAVVTEALAPLLSEQAAGSGRFPESGSAMVR